MALFTKRNRSSHGDTAGSVIAVSASARPYIYTNQEIEQLLAAARSLPPAGGLCGWKYHCLLGLLSVTGLRLGEALNLKLDDIDLHNNVLTIEKAKLGKSRLVPIHRSTRKGLVKYLQRRKRLMLYQSSLEMTLVRDSPLPAVVVAWLC